MILDAIASIGGLIIPPVFDFIKKKFLGNEDTPEATLSTLATTKPEVMPDYVNANAHLLEAQIKFFNRDVIGMPSQWIVNLRASIRPIFVIMAMIIIVIDLVLAQVDLPPGIRQFLEVTIASWFGSRITQ